jgi:site-specific DNA-methyltransferase (adenine-specific)
MITRLNGDCLTIAHQIPDSSIDLLLTDPPYNISKNGANPIWLDKETGKNKTTIHNQNFSEEFDNDWDDVGHEEFQQQLNDWARMWFTKLRKGGSFAIFISDRYLSYLITAMNDAGFESKRVWTWKKPAAVPFNRRVNPVSGCEYVLFGIKPKGSRTFNADATEGSMVERYAAADKVSSIVYKYISQGIPIDKAFAKALADSKKMLADRKRSNGLIECVIPNTITYSGGLGKDKIHPTQKPTEVLEYFIELLSKPGDMVLDTFAGSGSTGIAASNKNRRCILIEQDTSMFTKMDLRFQQIDAINNLSLTINAE